MKEQKYPQETISENLHVWVDKHPEGGLDFRLKFLNEEYRGIVTAAAKAEGLTLDEYMRQEMERVIQERVEASAAVLGLSVAEWMKIPLGDKRAGVQLRGMDTAQNTPQARPRRVISPSPFDNEGKASVSNNVPVHVLLEAVAKGGPNARNLVGGWRENTQAVPVFRDPQRVKGNWLVAFDNDGASPAEVWRRVETLSPLHSKIALFFLARICDPRSNARYPTEKPVAISYEDLRRVLGYTRKGEEWETFKRRMNTIVKDISDLKATVRGIEIFGKQDGIAECAIFTISKVWHEQGELFGDMVQVGWLVDPGPWAKYFFNREAKPWQATLARTLLELDHRGVRRADVLALHIATLLFAVAGGTHYQDRAITRTVAELLELAGELPEPQHRGGHWARRTEAALSAALETMLQTGLLASVAFGAGYPTDPEDDPEDDDRDRLKRGKGWVERWLAAEVTMLAPDAAAYLAQGATDTPATTPPPARTPVRQTKATARLAKKRQDRKLDPGQRIDKATAARLRAAIKEQYGTQEIAAQFFKCTGATLSRALNGIHAPNPDLAKRLLALLDSPQEA